MCEPTTGIRRNAAAATTARRPKQIPVTPALAQQLQTTLPSAMMITTKHGTVIVPSGFKARESKDGRAHACIIKMGFGQARLTCLWLPPNI